MASLIDDDPNTPGRCPWCRRRQPDAPAAAVWHWMADVVLWRVGWARWRWLAAAWWLEWLVLVYAVHPVPLVWLWVPAGVATAVLVVSHVPRGLYELVRLVQR